MGWLDRLSGRRDTRTQALWEVVVREGRAPHWYLEGGVPDTLDGRFDTIATVLAATLLRLETEPAAAFDTARLTERFVEDMDPQMREIGIGDLMVGKHVGRMMQMLGGRLGAYRQGFAGGDLDGALLRNLYRGADPGPAALAHAKAALLGWRTRLAATPTPVLVRGEIA